MMPMIKQNICARYIREMHSAVLFAIHELPTTVVVREPLMLVPFA
jgi:hypothetical protein